MKNKNWDDTLNVRNSPILPEQQRLLEVQNNSVNQPSPKCMPKYFSFILDKEMLFLDI